MGLKPSILSVTASAPARCGIIGNPSDIYGGKVLSCSVPSRATCMIERSTLDDFPVDLTLWTAATRRLPLDGPVSVRWLTDIPRSSGLAGSTALLTATVLALLTFRGEAIPPIDLAELVRDIERNEAGIMCGYQDAYMASIGGLNFMNFQGKHPVHVGPPATVDAFEAELPFLLVTTGVERLSGSVHAPMAERWLAGESLVRNSIERIHDLAEIGRDALLRCDYASLADAMNENQHLIAGLGGSGEAIDRLIADCMESGAMAAKLAGAGMGGTVIALSDDLDELQSRLRLAGYTKFLKPDIVAGAIIEALTHL